MSAGHMTYLSYCNITMMNTNDLEYGTILADVLDPFREVHVVNIGQGRVLLNGNQRLVDVTDQIVFVKFLRKRGGVRLSQ